MVSGRSFVGKGERFVGRAGSSNPNTPNATALRSHQAMQHPNLLVSLLTIPADRESEAASSSSDNYILPTALRSHQATQHPNLLVS
ncbi:MAG: hypothetical protein AAF135_13800 [Bacteroidota bacterium]